jgi:hypothetical protein
MDFLSKVTIGVIGGLVATFLTFVIRRLWLSIVVPWYEERVYQDAHFEGLWDAKETYSDRTNDEYTFELTRQGHQANGTLVCVRGPDEAKTYLLTGSFKNLILTLTWVSREKSALDRGAWTLKLTDNGMKFVGYGAYYSPSHDVVESSVVEARKKP